MNFTELLNAVRSHFMSFLAFLVLFSAAVIFLWGEKKEIEDKQAEIHKQLLIIKNEELVLERKKHKHELELKDKKYELEKKEEKLKYKSTELKQSIFNVEDKGKKSISNKEDELNFLIDKYDTELQKVKELVEIYSQEARRSKAEDIVINIIKEFSELGVSLNKPDWCNNEYMARYYKGEVLLDQISALNNKYSISEEYSWFVKRQSAGFVSFNEHNCEAKKNINTDVKNKLVR